MANARPGDLERLSFLPGGQPGLPVARAEGCFLVTPDGRRVLDASGGAIVSNIGHGRQQVAEAAARALAEVDYVVPPFWTEHRERLVTRLQASWLPEGLQRCMFTSGGAESVDAALRIARQFHVARGDTGRWKVIGRELSYHGTTISTLAAGGHAKRRKGFEPYLYDWPKAPTCYSLRCERCAGETACNLACADALEATIQEAGPETVSALVFEPIGGSTAGALTPPPGYWERVQAICRTHGILLIADEVMSGFGRTGTRFAIEHWDVQPDLLVGGKGLAGGYAPIGGVYARDEVVAPIAESGQDVMFYTYAAHPASCAVADKVLEILERESLVARAAKMGEALADRLAPLRDHPHVAELRGRGLLQAVEIVRDKDTLDPYPADAQVASRIVAAGVGNGAFFYPGGCGPAQDVIVLGPPFIIQEEELDLLADALTKSIDAVTSKLDGAA